MPTLCRPCYVISPMIFSTLEFFMAVFTLLVIALLCLFFKSTRLAGVVGLTLLSLLNPLVFIGLLAVGGGAIYLIHKRSKLNVYAQPKLP